VKKHAGCVLKNVQSTKPDIAADVQKLANVALMLAAIVLKFTTKNYFSRVSR
jgi:hypothetical protein